MTPIQQVPEYAHATSDLNNLCSALGKVEARILEVEALLRTGFDAEDEQFQHVAAALEFAQTGKVTSAAVNVAGLSDEHLTLRQQRTALTRAIEAKREELRRLSGELSAAACRELDSTHRRLAGRYMAKLQELDELWQQERDLFAGLNAAGYDVRFSRVIACPWMGRLNDPTSALAGHARELRHYAIEG